MNCPNGCGEMEYDFEGAGYECLECGKFVGDEETNPQNDIPDPDDLSIPSSVDDQPDEYVEKNKLRALVELWREEAEENAGNLDWKFIHNRLADQLQEVLENE